MRQKGWLFSVCLLAAVPAPAQETGSMTTPDSARAHYVQSFPGHFFLWPVLKRRSLDFEVGKEASRRRIDYRPNTAYTFGLGAYLFDLAFEITFAVPLGEKRRETYGVSRARDFQVNALTRNWGIDFFNQKYAGFYVDDPELAYLPGTPYPQRDDIAARNFGLTVLYVFNDTKYSLRSSFNFAERQRRRGGSFLLTGTVNSFRVAADSAILDEAYQAGFGVGSSFYKLRNTTFSIAPGYAYNYIYKNFFLSGALMIGPAHNWIYYESEQGEKNDIRINSFTSARIGVGFNGERFFGGINFVVQSRAVRFDDIRLASSTSTFRFLIGYRFREFGVLKKSVWDVPKQLLL